MHYSELNYNSSQAIRGFLEARGIRLQKRFGQNFLVDPHKRAAICRLIPAEAGQPIWEIGPGIGALTHELLQRGDQLTLFEIDYGLIAILQELFADDPVAVVAGDCVTTLPEVWQASARPAAVVGNLPYNAASAILMAMLEGGMLPPRLITMVQRESALRMTARPGSKDYSAYSVACQARSRVSLCFDVPPEAFFPRPEVVSTVVQLVPLDAEPDLPPWFSPLVRRAFSSRRKTLRNNMKNGELYPGITGEMVLEAALGLGIAPETRAERIGVDEFIQLSRAVARQGCS
ncbi:16S rRNA (adenine(1518)-N(6)/adenine(1519)-N(6))-dimethyltransferase RsmA [Spirochaeta africana]|uniref:Ribosomal RNA small subunit methyltransferase A n=1 Tax=Spirochaeta africana (strain ATCC 700263 / DSM 8902 / Z-7692) TaxID=889378 RepID=H9UL49_SPIAZ|nr:16S rRNA (adenine(1518)-N(6)/adenine(1519)-N(6))-dimethyltransferase RsmA [Spirochaeta africana]AFG38242.1 dimethyladenosine transferase [Spirochaeta africana DSM 8902]